MTDIKPLDRVYQILYTSGTEERVAFVLAEDLIGAVEKFSLTEEYRGMTRLQGLKVKDLGKVVA